MEILLVKDFLTHEFYKKISAHLLLGFLTHLLYNIQLIQSTAANMVCAVMLGYSAVVFFKLEGFLRFYFPSLGRKKWMRPILLDKNDGVEFIVWKSGVCRAEKL